MTKFDPKDIDLQSLKQKAFNYRWAECKEGVIPLTAADLDFKCSIPIRQAIIDYCNEGYFCYGPNEGVEELRVAVSNYYQQEKNIDFDPKQILPLDSVARAMYVFCDAILKPGDEIIIFDPVDFLFASSADSVQATIRRCSFNKDGSFDKEQFISLLSSRTKAIGLCNPHNPFGQVVSNDDLKWLLSIAREHNLTILNDEIWSDIIYSDSQYTSIEQHTTSKDNVVTVYGFSKSFGLAGLRIGVAASKNPALFKQIYDASYVQSTAGGVSTLSQVAAIAALTQGREWFHGMLEYLEGNRDYCIQRLKHIAGLTAHVPHATYLLFIDIRELGVSSEEFVELLELRGKLRLVPGSPAFFGPGASGYVRLSFATSREILKEAFDRLENFIQLKIYEDNNEKDH